MSGKRYSENEDEYKIKTPYNNESEHYETYTVRVRKSGQNTSNNHSKKSTSKSKKRPVNKNGKVVNKYTNESTEKKGSKDMSKKRRKKKRRALRILGFLLLILVLLIIGAIAAGYGLIDSKIGKMGKVEIDESSLNVSQNQNISKYRNIAIFGIDSRKDDYGVGNRSDCIIIASLNNKTKEVNLISVYRDSYLQIEGHGLDKVTHAYSYGGAPLAIKTLNQNLDLNITEFVTVNFDSVAEAVDLLGGIQMNVTEEERYWLNGYIVETSQVTGKPANYLQSSGLQTLDGVQAVAYSRIRYTSGGDYKRTERMRDVIEAMFAKIKKMSLGQINTFVDKMLPRVYTNITTGDIISLLPSAMSIKIGDSMGWPYNVKDKMINGVSYTVPVTLESSVIKLHKEEFGDENYELPSSIKTINDKIVTKTGLKEQE